MNSTMAKRSAAALGVGALALSASATAAFADEHSPNYPPLEPSSASAVCVGDIPYLSFAVDFGPDFANEEVTITWSNPQGEDPTWTRTLDASGRLSGNDILWPGASENPPDWPGWILVDGQWVEADDGFLWARGTSTITFETNPTEVVQVTYPPSTAVCANPPTSDAPPPTTTTTTSTTTTSLPKTGGQTVSLVAVGGGLLAGGTALVVASRRRNQA